MSHREKKQKETTLVPKCSRSLLSCRFNLQMCSHVLASNLNSISIRCARLIFFSIRENQKNVLEKVFKILHMNFQKYVDTEYFSSSYFRFPDGEPNDMIKKKNHSIQFLYHSKKNYKKMDFNISRTKYNHTVTHERKTEQKKSFDYNSLRLFFPVLLIIFFSFFCEIKQFNYPCTVNNFV